LSKIADLKVIPRTSTQHYKSAPENLPEIARQLRVRTSWKAACRRAATIGPRFSDASLVTAAWLITARGPGTLEGDQR